MFAKCSAFYQDTIFQNNLDETMMSPSSDNLLERKRYEHRSQRKAILSSLLAITLPNTYLYYVPYKNLLHSS